jgi:hypothetical protein
MVWAAFWGFGNRTPLYIIERDFESKKNRFSANSYIDVLDAHAQYISNDTCFIQDNASIHTVQKVKDWFKEQKVRYTDWPPYPFAQEFLKIAAAIPNQVRCYKTSLGRPCTSEGMLEL